MHAVISLRFAMSRLLYRLLLSFGLATLLAGGLVRAQDNAGRRPDLRNLQPEERRDLRQQMRDHWSRNAAEQGNGERTSLRPQERGFDREERARWREAAGAGREANPGMARDERQQLRDELRERRREWRAEGRDNEFHRDGRGPRDGGRMANGGAEGWHPQQGRHGGGRGVGR